jgi:predicted SAM-dependent methyltransferase
METTMTGGSVTIDAAATAAAEEPGAPLLKVNLGCGPIQPEGWENVDGSIRAFMASRLPWLDVPLTRLGIWPPTEFSRATRFANLQKPLPWSDNTVDCVYLGEVLEHFTRTDGVRLLSECFRVVKPGGAVRVRVPDNGRFWRNYVRELDQALARPQEEWTEDHTRWVDMFFHDICVERRITRSYGHYHKWMYDEISLIRTFQRVGFVNVARRDYLESAIPGVKEVESHADLTVEGTKPR